MYAPDLGYTRVKRLQARGITRIEQILDAPPEVLREIQFGPARIARLRAYLRARDEQRAVWMSLPKLPAKALYFDVETGIVDSGAHEPWMIGASTGEEVRQWVALDEDPVSRREMYGGFLDYVRSHPGYTLCSWSATNFDNRAMEAGLARWMPEALPEWHRTPKQDLAITLRRAGVLPVEGWSLKTVAPWVGFEDIARHRMDGFAVGMAYERYRAYGDPVPLEEIESYNADDVSAVHAVLEWARHSTAELAAR